MGFALSGHVGSISTFTAIILIIINIIYLTIYYSSRAKIKENRRKTQKELSNSKYIYKELEKDEKELINEYYKHKFLNKHIIKIQGIYSLSKDRRPAGSFYEFIGKYEIITKGLTKELKEDLEYEVLGVLHKGIVYILSVKECSSKNTEFKTLSNLIQLKKINEQKIIRTINFNENKMFWIPNFFFCIASVLLIFAVLIEEIGFQFFLIILTFILMSISLIFVIKKRQKVYSLKGILKEEKNDYFINDIRVNDYENWLENFEEEKILEIEGVKQYTGEMALEIIKVQNYSLKNKYKIFNKKRLLFYFLASCIYFLFSFYLTHYDTYRYYKDGLSKNATKVALKNYEQIKHNNFFINQYVEFKNIKYLRIHSYYGNELILLNQDLKTDYSKKLINKWTKEYDNISKIVNDYNKNDFEFTKDKRNNYFKKYKDYNRFLENKSHYGVDFYNFLQSYFKDINEEINNARNNNLKNLKKEIVITGKNITKYSDLGFSQVFYSRGNIITLRPLKLKEDFYGKTSNIKGYIQDATRKNGILYLKLSKKSTIDKTLNYKKEAQKADFLINLYKIISVIFAIFFIIEIFRIRYKNILI